MTCSRWCRSAYAAGVTPRRSRARCCMRVGVARMVVRRSGPRRTTLRVSVARSPSRVRKLCTGSGSPSPGSVRLWTALRCAAGEGSAFATGDARCRIVLVEQHRSEALTHVPFQIIGQHAEQDVRAYSWRDPMEHRTQLKIDGLERAEGVLDAAETFVGAYRSGGIAVSCQQVGADHIDAVECGLGSDAGGVLGEAETIVGDADLEMLGHVAPSQHGADRLADRRGAAQRPARLLHAGGNTCERLLGRSEERRV